MDKQIDFASLSGILSPSAYVQSWNKSLIEPYVILSTSISSSANNVIAFSQARKVAVDDPVAVESFLTNYSGIIPYLFDAPKKISEYFGDATLSMGLFSELDSIEDQPELYLEVETALSPEKANAQLSKLNREWLFASNDQDLMSLNITLRFV